MRDGELQALVFELVASGDAAAAAAVVGRGGRRPAMARAGHRDAAATLPLRRWDRFDLASLTKPWMATLALRLAGRGVVPLDLPLERVWPRVASGPAGSRLEDLLRHRTGLPAWSPLARRVGRRRDVAGWLLRSVEADAAVPTYSDLGYILWGLAVERLTGRGLAELLRRHVLRPLGTTSVGAAPPPERAVACGLGNAREVELAAAQGTRLARRGPPRRGETQDGNARFLGGLAGHAGLFASPEALWRLGAAWLRPGGLVPEAAVRAALAGRGRYRLGWWTRRASIAARPLSPSAFGHPGFTGGSLWIDPEADLVAVLLAHRTSVTVDLDPWRRRLHALALSRRRTW